jgi:hypothetical protein
MSFAIDGMQNGTPNMEASLVGAYKTYYYFTTSNCTTWYFLEGVENLFPHKNLHTDVHSSVIQIGRTWKQPGIFQ